MKLFHSHSNGSNRNTYVKQGKQLHKINAKLNSGEILSDRKEARLEAKASALKDSRRYLLAEAPAPKTFTKNTNFTVKKTTNNFGVQPQINFSRNKKR